jgi:feruloyl esterase
LNRLARVCLLALLICACATLRAADCNSLKSLQLENTTIILAESVTSGTVTIMDSRPSFSGLPAFCRVAGVLRPTADSAIHFEVWLPAQNWNGRLLGAGNGGFAGSIGYDELANYLKRNFAVAGSDAGHQGNATDATWAYGHPEKVKDFGWRAVHLTRLGAGEIISAFYGKRENKAYFDSCSDGGREALMRPSASPQTTTAFSQALPRMRGPPWWVRE